MAKVLKQLTFSKKQRLLKNSEFRAVLQKSRRHSDGIVALYAAENGLEYSRLGVSISRFCGGAVVRNRLKRLLREAFRISRHEIPSGFDYLFMFCPKWPEKICGKVMPKEAIKQLDFERVKKSMINLITKAVNEKN